MKQKLWLSVLVLGWVTGLASAQVDVSPGVARVSLIHGDVSTQRGDTNDWSAAALNQPIVAGDKVATGDRSRAEVQLDHGNILRLGNNSQANIANLTRTNIQVQVGQGLAFYSVFKESEADIEIDTPNVAVRPTAREGVYRIEVRGGETEVTVRKGSADISTPQGSARVEKGQSAIIRGTADEAEYRLASAQSKDSWDSWNNERDGVIRNAQAWGRTSRYYVGSEDLDAYGRWVNVPDYGYVWQPVVSYGWAPYRAGRWVWEPYWGWTWVSYEPWGWAPYHYGRWFLYGSNWVWWPGPVYPHYRPIWAPAYVSFFGFGGGHWGVSVGFGFGSFGWLPCGPGDRYYPWWGGHRSHYNVVNVTNVTNITNITNVHNGGVAPLHRGGHSNMKLAATNDRVREAVSTVPADSFGTGRMKPNAVNKAAFREAKVLAGDVPVVPTKASTTVSDRAVKTPAHTGQQRFYAKNEPPAKMESFDREASQVQEAVRRSGRMDRGQSQNGGSKPGADVASNADAARGSDSARVERQADVANDSKPRGEGFRRFGDEQAQNRKPDNPAKSPQQSPTPAAQPRSETQRRSEAQTERRDSPATSNNERGGWRKFSNEGSGRTESTPSSQPRVSTGTPQGEYRSARPAATAETKPSNRPAERGDGWQKFTPSAESGGPTRGESIDRGAGYENRSNPSYSRPEPSYRNETRSSRPPLDLRQPIVTPRPERSASPSYGGGGGARSSGGGGGRSEARSSGGGGGGGSRSSGGGGSHSSGGGHSGGGGGQSHSGKSR